MGLQRAGQIALRPLDAADIVVADRQVALPLGIVRVLRRQALADVEAGAMGLQRAGQIALRPLDAANSLVADRQVAVVANPLSCSTCSVKSIDRWR